MKELSRSLSLEAGSLRQLFSEKFYRDHHPDIPIALPCFLHFLKHGIWEGRDPNPFLQFSFVRDHYPVSQLSNLDILVRQSLLDTIQTSPYFDSSFYRETYASLLGNSAQGALAHYLRFGYSKGLRTSQDVLVIPSWMQQKIAKGRGVANPEFERRNQKTKRDILVVVPIYRDLAKTRACIQSLYESFLPTKTRVLIIDDACPEQELSDYLKQARDRYGFELFVNSSNLGFTDSINLANQYREKSEDLFILNSDTICPEGLLPRLARYLDAELSVATVTPLSNNATIATVPCIGEEFALFNSEDAESLDEAAWDCQHIFALHEAPLQVPTGVGFCMLINHKTIPEGPLFDSRLFGKGYGEEVHYCQQAKARGFVHVLATDVFVWHYSGASFGNEKWRRILASTQLINQLHPDYSKDVGRFCQHDPLAHHRLVITLWVLSQQDFQGILVITHALGGGIDRYLDDRAKALSNGEFLLLLQPTRVAHFCDVIFMHRGIRIAIALEVEGPHAIADAIRDLFPIHAVEIHSTVGYDMQLLFAILRSLQLSFKFFVHDFASICPRIQPRDEQNVFCGLPDTSSCNQCLQSAGETTDITSWRHQHQWLLYGAQQLIAPSRNTADLLRLVHAGLDPLVVPHEDQERILRERIRNQIKRLDKSAKDTVSRTVVIGRLTPHKGLHLVESISKLLALHGAEIVIIGTVEGASFLAMQKHVSIVGAYKDNDLLALIEQINPDVIFFPARWPETYSYTLSTALQSGYPLLAANVGAFSERMRDISECTLYRLSDSVEHIASLLMDLMSRNFDASSTPHRSMGGTTSDPLLVRFRS